MRNGQNNNKRMRGRNRKSQNPVTRVYESNGPDIKVRGTASHVAEKYVQLARDAQSSGDPVAAENYYQHAEHYFRLIAAMQEQFRQSQPFQREGEREAGYDDMDDDGPEHGMAGEPYDPRMQSQAHQQQRESQPYQPRESQPYQQRDSRYPPREQQHSYPQQQRNQPQPTQEEGDAERLPAFVTGGAQPPAPPAYGQNGFENGGGDRFPLHRRRRRRHGPRGEGSPSGESGENTQPRPPGE
jgi:hypothetical protein